MSQSQRGGNGFAAGPPQGETHPLGGQRSTRSGKRGGNIVFFDLDHTLLSGDSDVLWCDFLIAQGLLDAAGFGAQNADMDARYRPAPSGWTNSPTFMSAPWPAARRKTGSRCASAFCMRRSCRAFHHRRWRWCSSIKRQAIWW